VGRYSPSFFFFFHTALRILHLFSSDRGSGASLPLLFSRPDQDGRAPSSLGKVMGTADVPSFPFSSTTRPVINGGARLPSPLSRQRRRDGSFSFSSLCRSARLSSFFMHPEGCDKKMAFFFPYPFHGPRVGSGSSLFPDKGRRPHSPSSPFPF